jgi:hypothetical protein
VERAIHLQRVLGEIAEYAAATGDHEFERRARETNRDCAEIESPGRQDEIARAAEGHMRRLVGCVERGKR